MRNKKPNINSISHPLQSKEWGDFRNAWGHEVLQYIESVSKLTLGEII